MVADCRLDGESLPPGVTKFLDHIGRPWGTRPIVFTGTTTVDLPKDDTWTYRCHHVIDVNTDRPGDVRLKLDWQMMPIGGARLIGRGSSAQLVQEACVRANQYFEQFGGGGLEYGDS